MLRFAVTKGGHRHNLQMYQTKPSQVKRYYAIHDSTGNVYHVKDATDDTAPIQIVQAAEFLEAHEPVVETPPPPVKRGRRPRTQPATTATPATQAQPTQSRTARTARGSSNGTSSSNGTAAPKAKRTRATKAQMAARAAAAAAGNQTRTNGRKAKESPTNYPGEYVTAGTK